MKILEEQTYTCINNNHSKWWKYEITTHYNHYALITRWGKVDKKTGEFLVANGNTSKKTYLTKQDLDKALQGLKYSKTSKGYKPVTAQQTVSLVDSKEAQFKAKVQNAIELF